MKHKKCSKCKAPTEDGCSIVHWGKTYRFCGFCSVILDKYSRPENVPMHLDDSLPLNKIDRDMLNARVDRNNGKSLWKESTSK